MSLCNSHTLVVSETDHGWVFLHSHGICIWDDFRIMNALELSTFVYPVLHFNTLFKLIIFAQWTRLVFIAMYKYDCTANWKVYFGYYY